MAGIGTVFAAYEDNTEGTAHIGVYDNGGNFVRTIDLGFLDTWGGFFHMCIGANRTIYVTGEPLVGDYHTLWKLDEEGNILTSVTYLWSWTHEAMAIGIDGYLYIFSIHDGTLEKRDPDTLAVVATCNVGSGDYCGLVFYSETVFFTGEEDLERAEKWDFVSGFIESQAVSDYVFTTDINLALSGGLLCGVRVHTYAWTLPIAFTEGETSWDIEEIPGPHGGSTSIYGGDFILIGEVTNGSGVIIVRYTTAKELVWEVEVTESGYHPMEVAAYPYEVTAYDYPLYPVIFPLRT